jgi:hypothetical protein
VGCQPQIETGEELLHGAAAAAGAGRDSVLEQADNAGNPFWPSGEEEADRSWRSTAAGCWAEGTLVRGVERWLWRSAQGSGRSGAALRTP